MEENKHENIPGVQTYTDDMVKVIEDSGGTLVRKIIKEEEAREAEKKHPKSKKDQLFALAGSAFVIFGLAVLFFFALNRDVDTLKVKESNQYPKIIFTEDVSTLEIGGLEEEQIVEALFNKKNSTQVKKGGIEAIYLTEGGEPIGLRHFVALAEASLPLGNIDFVEDNFLIGVANQEEKNLFFLLKARSFPDIFPGMREWEKKMFSDLHGFFGLEINPESEYLLNKNFEDGIVKNKNARILYAPNGQPVLFYIFLDEQSTIVTTSFSTAEEVRLRLTSSEIKK